jgi:hypothetical protein
MLRFYAAISSEPCGGLSSTGEANFGSRSLLRLLRNPDQRAQNARGAFEARGRGVPFVEEHDFHVRADAGAFGVLADIGDEAFGVGEDVVAEREHRAFRADFDPFDIGAPVRLAVHRFLRCFSP